MLFILQDCLGCVDIIHILQKWLGIIQILSQLYEMRNHFHDTRLSYHGEILTHLLSLLGHIWQKLYKLIKTFNWILFTNLHAHAPHINANSWLLITPRSFSQGTFHKLQLSKLFLGQKTIHKECINICMYLLPIISALKLVSTHFTGNCVNPICKPNTTVRFRPAVVPSRIYEPSRFE